MKMQKKLYYAHSIELYWTEQEDEDLEFLSQEFPDYLMVNPRHFGYRKMEKYLALVRSSQLLVYRGETDGVVMEIEEALQNDIPVYSLATHTWVNTLSGAFQSIIVDDAEETT